MERDAADDPVTIIIRAPNQKYTDQTINCFLDWTVEKLKKHISNVYPSKPLCKEQRLVYSGRLLQDHQQLREVLRKQDDYHMVHLVCPPQSPSSPSSDINDTRNSPSTSDPHTTNAETSGSTPSVTVSSQETVSSSDGVRHRGGSTHARSLSPDPMGAAQWPQGVPFSTLPAAPPAGLPAQPLYSPVQMLWWQQMYARQYYMQYQAAMAASRASAVVPSPPPSPRTSAVQAPPNEPAAPMGPNPAPNPAPEERPANQNLQMNAQGGPMLNEDELNRDWLDWLYTVSRAAILLSIVYFYSSFGRFVIVIGAMLLVYLHQAGWFPFRAELQNPVPAEAPQDEVERNDIQEMERMMDDGIDDDDDGESGEEGLEDAGVVRPGFLTSTWSFISTFFTSLVPEGPPRAAN